ncbi:MAG: restriction endonuclease, partial [Planctomycetota bacterium]
ISLAALKREAVTQLEKIAKLSFDLDTVLQSAEALRYQNQLIARFAGEVDSPSEAFVKVLADPVYDGRFTAATMEKFKGLVRTSIRAYIADAVDRRLRSALEKSAEAEEQAKAEATAEEPEIITTAEELQGLYIVRAILGDMIPSSRVAPRDVRSYFGILLDDNNRKPICRLWFNGSKKYLGVFDSSKRETRIEVNGPDDLFAHAAKIRDSLTHVLK